MCVTVISCSLLVLQSHVQPQASIVEGASSEAGRLRGPPQKRAVRNADGADQSTALPAGWRSHFLHHGSGDHISTFQLWYTQFWGLLNMFWKTSNYLLYVLYSFLNHLFFFFTPQIETEMKGCLDFLRCIYDVFGFSFQLHLSTRPEKYLGDIAVWNQAEKVNCISGELVPGTLQILKVHYVRIGHMSPFYSKQIGGSISTDKSLPAFRE